MTMLGWLGLAFELGAAVAAIEVLNASAMPVITGKQTGKFFNLIIMFIFVCYFVK